MVAEIGALVLAGLFLFLAVAALAVTASLRRTRDRLLPAFSVFVSLFGTRLALQSTVFRELLGIDDLAGGFAAGTLVVWDVDLLSEEVVRVYRASSPIKPAVYRRGEVAEAEPGPPGWTLAVDELFA